MKKNQKQSKMQSKNNKITDCNSKTVKSMNNCKATNSLGFDDNESGKSFHLDENDEHSFELR